MNRREVIRQQLAREFTAYSNPARDLLLGMRRAQILHGLGAAEVMEHWLDERQVPGMHRIPIPTIDQRSKATFLRLQAERDAIPITPYDNNYDPTDHVASQAMHISWTRNHLWHSMHDVVLQMVDPWWAGVMLTDVTLPNQMDWEFMSNPQNAPYRSAWDALSNISYHVVNANEARTPDYSGSKPLVRDTVRSALTQEVLDRIISGTLGSNITRDITRTINNVIEDVEPCMIDNITHEVMLDLADMGMIDLKTYMGYGAGLTGR